MLNLNDPKDAKSYVLSFIDYERIPFPDPRILAEGTDDDFLLIAKQLFLFADSRQALGGALH